MNKLDILAMFPFYQRSPDSLRGRMVEAAGYARLPAGEFFYREGDACGHFAVVGRGRIRVFKIDTRLAGLLLQRFAKRRVISSTHEDIAAEPCFDLVTVLATAQVWSGISAGCVTKVTDSHALTE